MATVTVMCSRCGATVEGLWDEDLTAGFYDVSEGPWSEFARPDETILCDPCMQADPRYQAVYPAEAGPEEGKMSRARLPKVLAGKLTRELVEELAERGYQLALRDAEFGLMWWTDPDYPERAHWQAECLACGRQWTLATVGDALRDLHEHRPGCGGN